MLALLLAISLSPAACADFCSEPAVAHYADLLEMGGHGRVPHEVGAFLIRESDGTITMQLWPDRAHRRTRYRGVIPTGTIAVMHTHPHKHPNPSVHDTGEARRIALPVLVITPAGVRAAFPDGNVRQLVDANRLAR